MLTDFAAASNLKLQIFPTWPRSINPPTAFVDEITEGLTAMSERSFQRLVRVSVLVLFGVFWAQDQRYNAGDAIAQRDAFVDAFYAYVADRFHGFGPDSSVEPRAIEDVRGFVPDWLPPQEQKAYVAVRIVLEGEAST